MASALSNQEKKKKWNTHGILWQSWRMNDCSIQLQSTAEQHQNDKSKEEGSTPSHEWQIKRRGKYTLTWVTGRKNRDVQLHTSDWPNHQRVLQVSHASIFHNSRWLSTIWQHSPTGAPNNPEFHIPVFGSLAQAWPWMARDSIFRYLAA